MKKIAVAYVSGTRAEFGIVTPLLQALQRSNRYELQLYATGMHLMREYGETVSLMEQQFGKITRLDAHYKPTSESGTAQFLGELFPVLVAAFTKNKPDFVLVHGDRAEMLAVATVCLYLHIPVIHTQGGDISATDDNTARHAISKLAQLHFPATKEAKKHLISLGEPADRIHVVGTLSLDTLLNVPLMPKAEVLKQLKLPELEKYMVITMHPVSEEISKAGEQMEAVIAAAQTAQLPLIIIYPNADPGSAAIVECIESHKKDLNTFIFKNISYELFISLLSHATVWLGNSSAGVVDSPVLHVPVVNIGIRQEGRETAENILSVPAKKAAIAEALKTALTSKAFLKKVENCKNPWGTGTAVAQILAVLDTTSFDSQLLRKGSHG